MREWLFLAMGVMLVGCGGKEESVVVPGRAVAVASCAGCHVFPEPGLLDRETWVGGVLPRMGRRMGVMEFEGVKYEAEPGAPVGVYPEAALVGRDVWGEIVGYYRREAPEVLERGVGVEMVGEMDGFEIVAGPVLEGGRPVTTMVAIDERYRRILVGDAERREVGMYGAGGLELARFAVGMEPVDVTVMGETMLFLTDVGSTPPSFGKVGGVYGMQLHEGVWKRVPLGIDGLARPVQAFRADWDGDGNIGMLVCEYGHAEGGLSWFSIGDGKIGERELLVPGAGARRVVREAEGAYLVLFAQGDERIVRVERGKEAEVVLRFPPVWGCSDFQLVDFDADGLRDVVLVNGDNADESPVFKPYHGVRCYRNDGERGFEPEPMFFVAIDGATGVEAADFDGDGDVDLAVVAFFAEFGNGPGFVYLENRGEFLARGLGTQTEGLGRWLVMDSGDVDGDGDVDLVLGNYAGGPAGAAVVGEAERVRWAGGPAYLLIKNVRH